MWAWSGVTGCPGWTSRHPLHPGRERFRMRDHSARGATMPDVICPKCGRSKAVTDDVFATLTGKTIRCSGCKAEFVVEEQVPLDFLDAPAAPVIPPKIAPKIAPTLTKEQREAVAERNVADFRASRSPSHGGSQSPSIVYAIGKAVVWLFVACLVIAAALYAGNASSGGIGVLVFVASLIAILLTQVIDILIRIANVLEND